MSFKGYEKNLFEVIKTKPLSPVFVTELSELIPEGDKEVDLTSESIIQFTLVGDASDSYKTDEMNMSIFYAKEKAAISKESFMKFRYHWHLLNYQKKKMEPMKEVLTLIKEDDSLHEIIQDDPPLYQHMAMYFLQHGKKIHPIRKDIWNFIEGLLEQDKSMLIAIVSDVKLFIESEMDGETKNHYYGYIESLVKELEKDLQEEENHFLLDRLYEEVSTTSFPNLDETVFKERRANLALKMAKESTDLAVKIPYAQKASVIFSEINNQEGTKLALDILGESIYRFGTDPQHQIPIKLNEEIVSGFEWNRKKVFEIFSDQNVSLGRRVFGLAFEGIKEDEFKGVKGRVLIYRPYIELTTIKKNEEQLSHSIVSQIFPTVHLSGNKVIGIDERSIEARSLCYLIHFQSNVFPAMMAMKEDKDFNLEFLLAYLKRSIIVTDNDIIFIREALEHFFTNKFISFLSVIVPTIESLLRKVYEHYNGTDIIVQRRNNHIQTSVNLSDILKDDKVNENLSADFIGYLQYLLNDDTSSENIRNNVAHRLTGAEFYNEGRSLIVLHLLLVLTTNFQ